MMMINKSIPALLIKFKAMNFVVLSLISILLGFTFLVSGSAQAWTLDKEWLLNERELGSINQFFCKVGVVAGSDEQSGENEEKEEEEEEEPDCD